MIAVRDIITEALSRANIVPRRQAARGDMVESTYQLLLGIVKKYNNDNFLAFTQDEMNIAIKSPTVHIYHEDESVITPLNFGYEEWINNVPGQGEMHGRPAPTKELYDLHWRWIVKGNRSWSESWVIDVATPSGVIYDWTGGPMPDYQQALANNEGYWQKVHEAIQMQHLPHSSIAKISSIMMKCNSDEYIKLSFVPYQEFNNYTYSDLVYTYVEKSENEWLLLFKKGLVASAPLLKVIYNKSLELDLNSDLYIPDSYVELLITALTHKLAIVYPRLDQNQMQRLEAELIAAQQNVKTPKADSKYITREIDDESYRGSYMGILTGAHLWR